MSQLEQSQQEHAQVTQQLKQAQNECEQFSTKLRSLQLSHDELAEKLKRVESEKDGVEEELKHARTKHQKLEEEIDAMQQQHNQTKDQLRQVSSLVHCCVVLVYCHCKVVWCQSFDNVVLLYSWKRIINKSNPNFAKPNKTTKPLVNNSLNPKQRTNKPHNSSPNSSTIMLTHTPNLPPSKKSMPTLCHSTKHSVLNTGTCHPNWKAWREN